MEISIKKWEDILKHSNAYLPHAVVASTVLALVYPPSFAWFTTKYYAPALGFLMFAVGLNFSLKDFGKAFERPGVLAIGFFCQYLVKPLLGVVFAAISVSILRLPEAVGMSLPQTLFVQNHFFPTQKLHIHIRHLVHHVFLSLKYKRLPWIFYLCAQDQD
jgi:predicted Na+-dependent transporter